ncbi:LicD family protein [Priestia megaterium]|uniref:LicD family protein n=1 Tax=Priestia megaterium TaxID=1404 RepID=UPI003242516C
MITALKEMQDIQLKTALEVKRICEKYNIPYFLVGGTLLGAVRHEGFIPWDDDLDIGMLREDYEKFIKVAPKELSDSYFLQTWFTDKSFGLPFAKIRVNETKFIEQNSINVNCHNGIFIDIFPFDNVPNQLSLQKKHNQRLFIFKRLLLVKCGYCLWDDGSFLKKIIYKAAKLGSFFIPLTLLKQSLTKEMIKYNNLKTEKVAALGSPFSYFQEQTKKEWISKQINLVFEGTKFSCPNGYEKYLNSHYGDYMTLPPVENRVSGHGVLKVETKNSAE